MQEKIVNIIVKKKKNLKLNFARFLKFFKILRKVNLLQKLLQLFKRRFLVLCFNKKLNLIIKTKLLFIKIFGYNLNYSLFAHFWNLLYMFLIFYQKVKNELGVGVVLKIFDFIFLKYFSKNDMKYLILILKISINIKSSEKEILFLFYQLVFFFIFVNKQNYNFILRLVYFVILKKCIFLSFLLIKEFFFFEGLIFNNKISKKLNFIVNLWNKLFFLNNKVKIFSYSNQNFLLQNKHLSIISLLNFWIFFKLAMFIQLLNKFLLLVWMRYFLFLLQPAWLMFLRMYNDSIYYKNCIINFSFIKKFINLSLYYKKLLLIKNYSILDYKRVQNSYLKFNTFFKLKKFKKMAQKYVKIFRYSGKYINTFPVKSKKKKKKWLLLKKTTMNLIIFNFDNKILKRSKFL